MKGVIDVGKTHKLKGVYFDEGTSEERAAWLDGVKLDPAPSQKYCNHSPDGFNWGYHGSGPAQLALAVAMKVLPKDKWNTYQTFKRNVIAGIPQGHDFEIEFTEADFEEKEEA